MKKALLALLGVAMIAAFSGVLVADEVQVFTDVRDSIAAIDAPVAPYINGGLNAGGRGDGAVTFLSPTLPGGVHIVAGNDASLGSLTIYADYIAPAGNILSSLGLDAAIAAPAAGANALASASVTVWNLNADVGGASSDGSAWDGTAISTAFTTAGGGFKAVRVPVSGAPAMFDTTLGLAAGNGYRLATVALTAGPRPNEAVPGPFAISALDVSVSNNTLLTTQVNAAGTALALDMSMGYAAGAPEASTSNPGAGLVAGATSATADHVIVIKMHGDFDNDGSVTNLDLIPFSNALTAPGGTLAPEPLWTGDFDGDNGVTNLDLLPFAAVLPLP